MGPFRAWCRDYGVVVLPAAATSSWTILTNHAHVLVAVSREPMLRQREIAALVGITEGGVQRILTELEADGYVVRERIGRRNRYRVVAELPLRHPLELPHTVADVLRSVGAVHTATTAGTSER